MMHNIEKKTKQNSSILLGTVTRAANQSDKGQINKRKKNNLFTHMIHIHTGKLSDEHLKEMSRP